MWRADSDGQCIGPVPVLSRFNAHLPTTVNPSSRVGWTWGARFATKEEVNAAIHHPKDRAKLLTLQLSSNLRASSMNTEESDSRLCAARCRSCFVAQYWGELPEAWTEAEHRSKALRCVRAAPPLR